MERMQSKVRVRFSFYGFDCDPEEITLAVGIEPSEITRIGETRFKGNAWTVESGISEEVDLPTQVRSLLHRLDSSWPSLVQLGQRYDAVITCVVESYGGDQPAIYFEKDIVKRVAELNAHLDVDLYILP